MNLLLTCVYAYIACFAFALIFNINLDGAFLCSFGASIAWFVYVISAPLLGHNDLLQYFFASMALSVYSEIMARVRKCPTTPYLFVAILPLVPGAMVYKTMLHALNGEIEEFLATGLYTVAIAGSLAVGVLVVTSLVQMFRAIKSTKS